MIGERSRFASVASIITATVAAFLIHNGHSHEGGKRASSETVNAPCISAFQLFLKGSSEINASNRVLALIQKEYSGDYYNSSISHHYFVRTAPRAIQDALSEFVWTDSALKEVRSKFETSAGGSVKVVHDVFDEIYLMRPEFDLADQKKVHYDGNLKISGICTIRALTYISGKNATLFALTSQENFTTFNHTAVVLDFDRELHYVSLKDPTTQLPIEEMQYPEPRVMVKSALHVILPGTHPKVVYFRIALHRIMTFAARSFRRAFESKSHAGTNAPSKSNLVSMMAVDNLMRSLNKIHMALPLILIGLPLGAVFLAPALYPAHFLPYIAFIIVRFLFLMKPTAQLTNVLCSSLLIAALSVVLLLRSTSSFTLRLKAESKMHAMKTSSQTSPKLTRWITFPLILLHIAWIGVCFYVEANSKMASNILLAPWQHIVTLDDII